MHELAVTESVVAEVTRRLGAARVTRVVLEVGRLSGVASEAIRFCFDLCAEGTPLEGASLEILEPPGRARCRACGHGFDVQDPLAICRCGSADLELEGGQALLVRSVEVA